jgi:DNA-binding response OmpR family regulator
LAASPHRHNVFAFISPVKHFYSLSIRLSSRTSAALEIRTAMLPSAAPRPRILVGSILGRTEIVPEVGILIVDDDVASQRALKSVLDSEGWRVRIVPNARQALAELATGAWNLAIVNVAVVDINGPLFAILRELSGAASLAIDSGTRRKQLSVLFLVPVRSAATTQPVLESEELPYSLKPYHLHEFLERVSDLLVQSGAIEEPIRAMGNFAVKRGPSRSRRGGRYARRGAMFASREDYQMTEEEMAEYERQEEEDRKKREKERKDREHL